MADPTDKIRIDQTDAKGGTNEGVVRWVLLISLVLAIVAMTVIWITGALSQDAGEGAGTATQREKAIENRRADQPDRTDGIVSDTAPTSGNTVSKPVAQ